LASENHRLLAQSRIQDEDEVRAERAPGGHAAERAVLAPARGLHGLGDVPEFGVHVGVGATHAEQLRAGTVAPPPHDETAGRVGEEERANEDDDGRRARQPQRDAPTPGVVRRGVVDEVEACRGRRRACSGRRG